MEAILGISQFNLRDFPVDRAKSFCARKRKHYPVYSGLLSESPNMKNFVDTIFEYISELKDINNNKDLSKYFYSGGAFQVLQQVVESITNEHFATYMNTQLLPAIGMQHSIYQYPLTDTTFHSLAIPGFTGWAGTRISGGWHNYACTAAGGMWSTPSDLATFALNISSSYLGKKNSYLSPTVAQQMLTRQTNTDYGLGVVVVGHDNDLYFMKDGHNYGYHSQILMFPSQGKGIAIMTNSETGDSIINYAIALVAKQYQWPYYFPFFDELIEMPSS